jgi:hypothetical protein
MATGGLDAEEIRISETGFVFLAPIGSVAPVDVSSALDTSWHNVGYIDDDSGVNIAPDVSTEAIMKWQSKMPVKYFVSEVSLEITFTMNQVNLPNTEVYFYGAQWENEPGGVSHMVVPSNITVGDLERAMVIEFTDDRDDITRFYFPRGIVVEREEMTLNKSDVKLGITYHAMDNAGDMFEIFTNNEDIYAGI